MWESINVEEWKSSCPVLDRTQQGCPLYFKQSGGGTAPSHSCFPSPPKIPVFSQPNLDRRESRKIFKGKPPAWRGKFDFFITSGWRKGKRELKLFWSDGNLSCCNGQQRHVIYCDYWSLEAFFSDYSVFHSFWKQYYITGVITFLQNQTVPGTVNLNHGCPQETCQPVNTVKWARWKYLSEKINFRHSTEVYLVFTVWLGIYE